MTRISLTEAVGLALQTFREGAGLSVADAAAATGLTEGMIRSREAGTNVEADDVCTLATAYGVDFIQVWSLGQLLHMGDGTAPPSSPPPAPPPDIVFDVGGLGGPSVSPLQLERMAGMWSVVGQRVRVPRAEVLNWIAQGKAGDVAGMQAAVAAWVAAHPPT